MSLEEKIRKMLTEGSVPGQIDTPSSVSPEQNYQPLGPDSTGAGNAAPRATLPIGQNGGGEGIVNTPSSVSPEQSYGSLDNNNSGASASQTVQPAAVAARTQMQGAAQGVSSQAQQATGDQAQDPWNLGQYVDPNSFKKGLGESVKALFAGQEESLQEGFLDKATGLFEAAVLARVNHEMTGVRQSLQESAQAELEKAKTKLNEDVDSYLSYVVESWMKENKLAVEQGLRTEIAESFIGGLKDLFVENYIEVPTDKVDIVESLSTENEKTKSRLNEEIEKSIALSDKIVQLEKSQVLEHASKDLAKTDAERLATLTEGVEFDSKEMFAEKVAVIKEAHFKKATKPAKSAEDILAEQTGGGTVEVEVPQHINRYVQAINRGQRF